MLNCYIVDSLELIYQKIALINRKEIIKGMSGKEWKISKFTTLSMYETNAVHIIQP